MDLVTQGQIIEDVAHDIVSLEDQANELEQQAVALRDKAQSARNTLLHTITHLDGYLVKQTGSTSPSIIPKVFQINNLLIDLTDTDGFVAIQPLDDLRHYLKSVG